MSRQTRILLVDDYSNDRRLLTRALSGEGFHEAEFIEVETQEEFLRALELEGVDAVITDYQLGWSDGISVLDEVRRRWPRAGTVMYTGTGTEEIAVRAMKNGVDDYVVKSPGHVKQLPAAVRLAIERNRSKADVTRLEGEVRGLIDRLPLGAYRVTPAGEILHANPALVELLGYSDLETLRRTNFKDLIVDPVERALWSERTFTEGDVYDINLLVRHADESVTWVRARCRAGVGSGDTRFFEGVLEDLTEQMVAQRELERHSSFLELLQSVTASANEAGSFEEALAKAVRLICERTGWPLGHVWTWDPEAEALTSTGTWYDQEGTDFSEMRAASAGACFGRGEGLPGRVLETGRTEWIADLPAHEGFYRSTPERDAGVRSGFAFPIPVDGEVEAVVEFFSNRMKPRDPTLLGVATQAGIQLGRMKERARAAEARREAERRITKSERRYRSLVTSTSQIVWTTGPEGEITELSEGWMEYTGQSPEYVADFRWTEAIHPDDRERMLGTWERALATGTLHEAEVRVQGRDGEYRHFLARSTPVADDDGTFLEWFGTLTDITDRKDAAEERRRIQERTRVAEKMEAIGRLVGGIQHDFNNLLTVIMMESESALMDETVDGETRYALEQIRDTGERASVLTRRLLAFSRHRADADSEVFSLNDVVRAISHMLSRLLGEDIELEVVTDPDLGYVRADPHEMDHLLVNLVLNARDAMPQGGRIRIETRNVEALAEPGEEPGRPGVELSVSDTGEGIPPEVLDRIFEPFFTTKPEGEGTGLGLATGYAIVDRAGGALGAYSEPGQGTTIRASFPRVDDEGVDAEIREFSVPTGSETILLVEDDPELLKASTKVLEAQGYRVLSASDAQAALEAVKDEGDVGLLVSDVGLPGIPGPELGQRLRDSRPGLPVLFTSGYPRNRELTSSSDTGCHIEFLLKPYSLPELASAVRKTLDHGR